MRLPNLISMLARLWTPRRPRGVLVHTPAAVSEYPAGDRWRWTPDGWLEIFEVNGAQLATYRPNTWAMVEAGRVSTDA